MNYKTATLKYIKSTDDPSVNQFIEVIGPLHDNGKTRSSLCVTISSENSDYVEIMRQVEAGQLTIQEADSE
jgi:hypothetical protein